MKQLMLIAAFLVSLFGYRCSPENKTIDISPEEQEEQTYEYCDEDEEYYESVYYNSLPTPSTSSVYDMNSGNIYTSYHDGMGNSTTYDLNGNVVYGHNDGMGHVTYYDLDGNYVYGHDDGMGNVTYYDLDGNYVYGHDDGMGTVTIYDSDGDLGIINYTEW